MKKFLFMCLLAVLTISGSVSCANAQSKDVDTSGASKDVVTVCQVLDKAVDALKEDPSRMDEIGETLGQGVKDLDINQKLNPADKALLKKTMNRLMETMVLSQMEQNPQMVQMLGSLTDDQKKEMIDMAMKVAAKEVDAKIDSCETLSDFANMADNM